MPPPDALPRDSGVLASFLCAVDRRFDGERCLHDVPAWLRLAQAARGRGDGA